MPAPQSVAFQDVPAWSTHFLEIVNPEHHRVQQQLVDFFHDYAAHEQETIASGVAPNVKHHLFESRFDLFQTDLPFVKEVATFCALSFERAIAGLNRDFLQGAEPMARIVESWFHITRDGGYHDTHRHPNCSWCGIYYVDIGDSDFETRNGINRFYSPFELTYTDIGSSYLAKRTTYDVRPANGKLVLFPSYLSHSALPYWGQKERIVVSMNTRFRIR